MRKNREILKWKNNMRALAMVICLALTMQFASGCGTTESAQSTQENATTIAETFDFAAVPAYDGKAYVAVNDNVPFFTEEELSSASYETYGELDPLGRCTVCVASVGQDLMPTEDRESISSVTPSGWINREYDGEYLYNRCHLIGFQLTGENANEENLITGTRYMNVDGMLPFENLVADYVKETDNHVLYRVTPVFEGQNLVASGVQMELGLWRTRGKASASMSMCTTSSPASPSTTPPARAGRRERSRKAARPRTSSIPTATNFTTRTVPACPA